jgi:D-sedoheptulose 7-phosphate isomerase
MNKFLTETFNDSINVKQKTLLACSDEINDTSKLIKSVLYNGNKILICGNGGSASDSQHFAAELMVRYKKERDPFPAIALNTDSSIITASSNDYDFSIVFSRQIEALGNEGDLLIAISTSGNSTNIVKAIEIANLKKMHTVLLTGLKEGKCSNLNIDKIIQVQSVVTARIQETHILILHYICSFIERDLIDV